MGVLNQVALVMCLTTASFCAASAYSFDDELVTIPGVLVCPTHCSNCPFGNERDVQTISQLGRYFMEVRVDLSTRVVESRTVSTKEEANARQIFRDWTAHHRREYSNEEEESTRFATFWNVMKQVHAHNSKGASWKMGINHMSDMTLQEASAKVGGHRNPPGHIPGEDVTSSCGFSAQNANISVGVDWRDRDVLNPVKNQGACGSCWAYSTTGAVEAVTAIMTGEKVVLSEQELTDCNWLGSFCDGGNIEEGYKWAVANGIGAIETYPYNNKDHTNVTCVVDQAFSRRGTIDNYEMVPRGEENLRKAITVSPVSIGIDAFQQDFLSYKSGIYDGNCHDTIDDLDHAVVAVGFGWEDGVGYFVIRNSWTGEWGEGGYIRIKAGGNPAAGKCGIAMLATRPIKDGSVQFHVNGTWPEWAKKLDPSKKDVTPVGPGPVNPDNPPSVASM